MNTNAPWPDLDEAERRVLEIQTKLHRWASDDPTRRFDDLFNLVADPAFLTVAWDRVRRNRGARSAGVDGVAPRSVLSGKGKFLTELRGDLKARRFAPLPVREKLIPKKSGKLRGLGIPPPGTAPCKQPTTAAKSTARWATRTADPVSGPALREAHQCQARPAAEVSSGYWDLTGGGSETVHLRLYVDARADASRAGKARPDLVRIPIQDDG